MLQDYLYGAQKLFVPGAHSELRAQCNLTRRVTLLQGNLVANQRSQIQGVSARVYDKGSYGFASLAELSAEAAGKAIQKAGDNARFLSGHSRAHKPALPPLAKGILPPQKDFLDVPQKRYIDFAKGLDDLIARKYPGLQSRAVVISFDSMEKELLTSDGYAAHSLQPRAYLYVFLNGETQDGMPIEIFKAFGGSGSFDRRFTSPEALSEELEMLYKRLLDKQQAVELKAGLKTCILTGELAGMLAHEAVGHTVEADLVFGGSVAGHCLNKAVASPLVSMTDFASRAFGAETPLPVYVDDEGVLAQDQPLIENGILTGYMVNRVLGRHYGMEPKGNARAFLFNDEPLIRMRNTAILPGKDHLQEMIASVEDGYYLMASNNGQADTTGEFMFGITLGYEIVKGKLGRALHDTTISGVAFEMLKTVDRVSDTMDWVSSGFCGKKQPMPVGMGGPALRCQLMVGGK